MKKSIVLVSIAMIMNLLMLSCDLGDDVKCPDALTGELSATENELVGNWELTGLVADDAVDLTDDSVENPSTDIFQQFSACQKDVVLGFVNTRKYSIKQGYRASNCANKQMVEGTWKLVATKLTLVTLCSTQNVDIVMNTEKTMFTREDNYTFNDVYGFIINTPVTLTYEKMTP